MDPSKNVRFMGIDVYIYIYHQAVTDQVKQIFFSTSPTWPKRKPGVNRLEFLNTFNYYENCGTAKKNPVHVPTKTLPNLNCYV